MNQQNHKQKLRLLKYGWTTEGTARELNRMANQWVHIGSPHDGPRVYRELVAHEGSSSIISLVRYDILMKTKNKMTPVKIRLLALRHQDPYSQRPLDINWDVARMWSHAILGDQCGLAIYRGTKDRDGRLVQQWSLFCDDRWKPREPPLGIEIEDGVRWDLHEERGTVQQWQKTAQ